MLKKVIKVTGLIVNGVTAVVGMAFIAGTVAGSAVATDKCNMYFSVGDKTVIDGTKETTEEETEA